MFAKTEKTMSGLLEKLVKKAEELGWTVSDSSREEAISLDFYKFSDAGEDFGFSANAKTPEGIAEEVSAYYESFDPEEHAALWYGKRGAPGLRVLLDDADSIDDMLGELARELGNVVEEWYLEHSGDEDEKEEEYNRV